MNLDDDTEDDPIADALLDLLIGPPTIPPGDGAYAPCPSTIRTGLPRTGPADSYSDPIGSEDADRN